MRRMSACVFCSENSALSVRSFDMPDCEPFILSTVLNPIILYPAPKVRPRVVASTTWPAEVLSVSVRWSRYSALNVISLLSVTATPMSGAKRSVMATDEML